MATVTEKDIISHLREKIKFHQQEVKKIESVLTAFTGNPIVRDDQASAPSQKAQRGAASKANTPAAVPTKRNTGRAKNKGAATAPVSEPKAAVSVPVAAKKNASKPVTGKGSTNLNKNRAVVSANATPSAPVLPQDTSAEKSSKTKAAAASAQKNKGSEKKSPVNATAPKAAPKQKDAAKPAASAPVQAKKTLEIPSSYSDKMTINSKIAFALNEIGEGYNEDIANAMAQYEPQSDAKKLSKQISGILSTLKNKGFLTATRDGRKDKYTLVK